MTTKTPAGFIELAKKQNNAELADRFDLSIKVVRRMRKSANVPSPASQVRSALPDDFSANAHMTNRALATIYGDGEKVIRRFRREITDHNEE